MSACLDCGGSECICGYETLLRNAGYPECIDCGRLITKTEMESRVWEGVAYSVPIFVCGCGGKLSNWRTEEAEAHALHLPMYKMIADLRARLREKQ